MIILSGVIRSKGRRRQLVVFNIVKEIVFGCHLFDVHVKIYFIDLTENKTLFAI
jgi:hypothetical protein